MKEYQEIIIRMKDSLVHFEYYDLFDLVYLRGKDNQFYFYATSLIDKGSFLECPLPYKPSSMEEFMRKLTSNRVAVLEIQFFSNKGALGQTSDLRNSYHKLISHTEHIFSLTSKFHVGKYQPLPDKIKEFLDNIQREQK